MNQTFSLARFSRLHRWLWANKGRTYLIGITVLVVIGCLNLSRDMNPGFTTYNLFTYESHVVYFTLLATVLTVGIGSDVFSALFRQESAITYLMLPASRSEKFWLGALYCLVSLTVFTVVYFGFELFAFSVANGHLKLGETQYVSSLVFFGPDLEEGSPGIYTVFYFMLLLVGISSLGSFYFRRGVLVRNIGSILMLLFGLVFLYNTILGLQFSGLDLRITLPFRQVVMGEHGVNYNLYAPHWLMFATYGFILLAFWVIARVRFNEIER